MGKSAPTPPDPVATAAAQAKYNKEAAYDSARLNQVNQLTPWGRSYWTGDVGETNRTQHTVYNPIISRILMGDTADPDGAWADALAVAMAPTPEEPMEPEGRRRRERQKYRPSMSNPNDLDLADLDMAEAISGDFAGNAQAAFDMESDYGIGLDAFGGTGDDADSGGYGGGAGAGGDGGDGLCFLTTAATGLGETDDGPTLSTLRQFRDNYMLDTPERRKMVEQYYAVAPKIVQSIPKGSPEWGAIGQKVQGIAGMIQSGKTEDAMQAYSDMMADLSGRYLQGTGAGGPETAAGADPLAMALYGGQMGAMPSNGAVPAPMTTV